MVEQAINNLLKEVSSKNKHEFDVLAIWHSLMTVYGWIPLDEFLDLDANIINRLVELNQEIMKRQSTPSQNLPKTLGGNR